MTDLQRLDELALLRRRLQESEETLRAITYGEVDALVVGSQTGAARLFTLAGADQTYRSFVENMSDGAATVSADGVVLYANQSLATLVGSTCARLVGRDVMSLVTAESRGAFETVVGVTSPSGTMETSLIGPDSEPIKVMVGASTVATEAGTVACLTFTDLTREREADARLAHLANHDALTGLPNRSVLTPRIQAFLDRRLDCAGTVALLFCDVDGFKNVNDAFGHGTGDDVLRVVADRLVASVGPDDTVARIGGDEFVILCADVVDAAHAADIGERVRHAVAAPDDSTAPEVEFTISVGVAVAGPGDDADPDTLLRDADEAMYKAKRDGPNAVTVFDEVLRQEAAARVVLLTDLRKALARDEMRLVYQTVREVSDERAVGSEALIRWDHPRRGLVPPAAFIPFAEQSGLIIEIGAWVIHEACRQAAAWASASITGRAMTMSVNVSGRQLTHEARLVDTVRSALSASRFDPALLTLEVTESALMADAEVALDVVTALKALGVRIAIDDFGTGYSSLVYLKQFPADLLKIDRSFVAGLGTSHDDGQIVRSIVDLADAFGIQAVAEGIETRAQLETLAGLGCRFGQGFFWGPPGDHPPV